MLFVPFDDFHGRFLFICNLISSTISCNHFPTSKQRPRSSQLLYDHKVSRSTPNSYSIICNKVSVSHIATLIRQRQIKWKQQTTFFALPEIAARGNSGFSTNISTTQTLRWLVYGNAVLSGFKKRYLDSFSAFRLNRKWHKKADVPKNLRLCKY